MNFSYCFILVLVILALPFTSVEAQKKKGGPITSPTIHDDGRVTFRIKAANATKVSVTGEAGKHIMTRDGDSIWSVTLQSVKPGLYGYSINIDGVSMLDPGNMSLKPGRSPKTSILYIPGTATYDFLKVPHGTVHYHGYHSKPINKVREIQVYTPPGYETSKEDYPLLVLQHGHSDSFASWTGYGKAHWILDNLIASGKAKPMIVLMADGHPIPESYGNGRDPANTEELRRDLMEAALPMVEKLYRVKPGRENRAIVGLSMGGLHSLTIGLNELDHFAWVGAFSAAVPEQDAVKIALADSAKTNEQLKLLWIACGKEDFLLGENKEFVAALNKSGIKHEWMVTEGTHSWPVWRGYLADFVPRIFR
ncbi:MAG: alpha/beta hydrolase-fold protein [Verrucomicrobiota bacterium]